MIKNSLVFRLSLSFALTTFALMGFGSLYLYGSLNRILLREGEDDLHRAVAVLMRHLGKADLASANLPDGLEMRILDGSGRVVIQTLGMPPLQLHHPGQLEGAGPIRLMSEAGAQFMVLDTNSPYGWIQVARDLSPEARRLNRFRRTLWATLGLTTLAAAIVGLGISKKGLQPLRHLANQAMDIHPEALATRLHIDQMPTELSPLVEALNHSLSRLETAFARLAALNADMAHELRTPVHSLKVETERLLRNVALPPEAEEGLSSMMETLDHMGTMIGQMLFLARIEDPSAVLIKSSHSVSHLLQQAMEPFELLAEEAGVRLVLTVSPDLQCKGDGTLLRRALHNLIDNSIRHSPAGSTVSIEGWASPEAVVLCVSDQGEGISETHRQQLGQRFLRPDPSRSRGTGGTGLGLAIVQSILHLHGGELRINSNPSEGTRVHLLLPRT